MSTTLVTNGNVPLPLNNEYEVTAESVIGGMDGLSLDSADQPQVDVPDLEVVTQGQEEEVKTLQETELTSKSFSTPISTSSAD